MGITLAIKLVLYMAGIGSALHIVWAYEAFMVQPEDFIIPGEMNSFY